MSEGLTSSTNANYKVGLLTELSAQRTFRHPITIGSSFHAAGGVLIGLAIAAFAADMFSNDTGINVAGGFIFNLIGIAALWLVAYRQRSLIIWATAALQVLVPFTFLWLCFNRLFKFEVGLPLILAALAMTVLWALPGFRARPSILASALLWTTLGVVLLIVQSNFKDQFGRMGIDFLGGLASDAGLILMLLGIGLLFVGWRFDRALWPNLATPFIAVGTFALIFGTFGYLSRDDLGDVGAAILVLVLSLAVICIGTTANRRATTWISTFFLAIGFFFLVDSILSDDTSLKTSAIVLAIVGALLAFAGNKFGQPLAKKLRGQNP